VEAVGGVRAGEFGREREAHDEVARARQRGEDELLVDRVGADRVELGQAAAFELDCVAREDRGRIARERDRGVADARAAELEAERVELGRLRAHVREVGRAGGVELRLVGITHGPDRTVGLLAEIGLAARAGELRGGSLARELGLSGVGLGVRHHLFDRDGLAGGAGFLGRKDGGGSLDVLHEGGRVRDLDFLGGARVRGAENHCSENRRRGGESLIRNTHLNRSPERNS